jgi:hypothetical protein
LSDIDGDGILDFASANYNGSIYSSMAYAIGVGVMAPLGHSIISRQMAQAVQLGWVQHQ